MNNRESVVKARLEADGWSVQKTGWPDLLCSKHGEIKAVEVKAFGIDKPTEPQETALYLLGKLFTTEVQYVNNRGRITHIENYTSPPFAAQRAKTITFDGIGIS